MSQLGAILGKVFIICSLCIDVHLLWKKTLPSISYLSLPYFDIFCVFSYIDLSKIDIVHKITTNAVQ